MGVDLERSVIRQLGLQFIGSAATIVDCGVVTFVIFKILDAAIGLRVTDIKKVPGSIWPCTMSGATTYRADGRTRQSTVDR